MIKVALEAGHGIETYPLTGAKGVPRIVEFEFNSAVPGYAQKLLTNAGYGVVLTQPLDANTVSLSDRLNIAVKSNVDLLISIHSEQQRP